MSLRARTALGLKWQVIEIGGRQLLSFAVFAVLARLLKPTAFGLLGLVWVYLAFAGMFVELGIGTAIIQRKELEPDHIDAAFWLNMICACVIAAATVGLARNISILFAEPELETLLRWASLTLIINAAAVVQHSLFFREMDFRRPAIRTVLGNAAGGIVGIAMAFNGWGVWSLIGQQLTAALAGTIFLWTSSSWRPTFRCSIPRLRELIALSSSVFAMSFLWFFTSRLDQLVVAKYFGAGSLGQYVVGAKLVDLAKMAIQQPAAAVCMPAFASLQDNPTKMCHAIYEGMQLNTLISFAAFGGLASVAPTLVPILFGEQWRPAIPILQLWSLHALTLGLFVCCSPALLASGKSRVFVLNGLVATFGAIAACIVGALTGMKLLLFLSTVNVAMTGWLSLRFLKRQIGLSPILYFRSSATPAIAALVMYLIVATLEIFMPARCPPILKLFVQVLVGAAAYSFICFIIVPERLVQVIHLLKTSVAGRRPAPH